MEPITIWHNPACSKSRAAHAELAESGIPVTVRRYRDDPPTPEELAEVLGLAGLEPWQACRTREKEYTDLGMADWDRTSHTRQQWLEAMSAHPRLIERPIVIRGEAAVVARDAGWQRILAD